MFQTIKDKRKKMVEPRVVLEVEDSSSRPAWTTSRYTVSKMPRRSPARLSQRPLHSKWRPSQETTPGPKSRDEGITGRPASVRALVSPVVQGTVTEREGKDCWSQNNTKTSVRPSLPEVAV